MKKQESSFKEDFAIFIVFVLIVALSLTISAFPSPQRVNTNISLTQTCNNCTSVNITSILLGNGTLLELGAVMTKNGTVFNYTLSNIYTKSLGEYCVNGIGNDGDEEIWRYCFEVTRTGNTSLSQASSTFYIVIFGVFVFLFIITVYGIHRLPSKNSQGEDGKILSISYLKYFRSVLWFTLWMFIVALFYLLSNVSFAYLEDELLANFMFMLFRVTMALTVPILIVWTIWIFAQINDDRKISRLWKRGIFSYRGL